MKNKQLISTLIYIYLIILAFIILCYLYSRNNDLFTDTANTYDHIVSNNITTISKYISDNQNVLNKNNEINDSNKIYINKLMENSVNKLSAMIDNYVLSI
jgi:hypothetical protein